ncbi:MAG: sigma factor-like helix-turn-helix DNA-binding protein [Clostridia bacterium]|nr:sigma factor-like helix-turn-helix DNA-binding protein [Clostridia bacterium]
MDKKQNSLNGKKSTYERKTEQLLYARKGIALRMEALEEKLTLLRALRDMEPQEKSLVACREKPMKETCNDLIYLLPEAADTVAKMVYQTKCALARERLAANQIDNAVNALRDDPYFSILQLKYAEGMPEEEIAYQIHCDPSTVRRNKNRLLKRLAVIFFGIAVMETAG